MEHRFTIVETRNVPLFRLFHLPYRNSDKGEDFVEVCQRTKVRARAKAKAPARALGPRGSGRPRPGAPEARALARALAACFWRGQRLNLGSVGGISREELKTGK